ncbi:MAG: hypothetical protein O3C40_14685 [Planctomycetota bacterium]|nr:hypothetical protein [Planctomycetota bacterium]
MKTRHVVGNLLPVIICGLTVAVPACFGQEETGKKKPPIVTYEDDVLPILRQKCLSCHNPDKKSGDLDMSSYSNLMRGGGSGEVLDPGDSSASYLYSLITHESEPYMPPEQPKLPDEMIETIRKWVDGGVLETKASTAKLKKKKTFDLALQSAPTERPAVSPMPPRLSLEPVTRTQTTTAVSAMATSPWSPLAAVASEKQVLLYNTQTLELVGTLPFPEGKAQVLKFSRNGSLLLAGGGQGGATGKAIVWNVLTGERVFEVGDELDTVLAADISSDQTLIALGGPQRVVRIYSTESGRLLHELRKHTDWICSLEFSPDSVLLATGDRAGGLYVWEGWTGREYLTLKAHTACVTDVSWRGDSNVVASCSEDGSIRLWEMDNGGEIKNWGAHGGGTASLEFTRDGRIFSCGRDRVPRLWDQNGAKQLDFEAFGDLALEVSFCNETNRAMAGDWTGAIRVWNAADGVRIGDLTPNPPTLAERLAASTQFLTVKQAEHKPLADAYVAAQSAADKVKADLAAAQLGAAEAKKLLDAAAALLATATQTADQATKAYEAAALAVTALADGVPKLNEASTMAETAAKLLKDDAELAKLAESLKAIAAKKTAQLEADKKTMATAATALETAKQTLATADKAATDADVAYKAAQKVVDDLTPTVKPAEDAAAAAKLAADAAAAALAAAQTEVNRWNGEIAFTAQLSTLRQQLADANGVLEEREIAHAELAETAQTAVAASDKAKAEVVGANEAVVAGQKLAAAAKVELAQAKATVTTNEAAYAEATKTVATYVAVLTPLNEAVAKAKDAATKAGDEKALVDAAATLAAIAATKQANLDAAAKDAEAKAAAVETAKQQVVASEKKVADTDAAVVAAQKVATDLAAAAKPLEETAVAATSAATAAAKVAEEAQAVVDQVNTQINAAKGIGTA